MPFFFVIREFAGNEIEGFIDRRQVVVKENNVTIEINEIFQISAGEIFSITQAVTIL